MADEDIFNYKRSTQAKEILSADFATISFTDEKAKLVSSVQGGYSHTVQPRYEAGSSALYFVNGQPIGNLTIGRLVGSKGWFNYFRNTNVACALLKPITIRLNGDNLCDLSVENDTIKIEDAILQSISFSFGAGGLDITENAQLLFAKMS